MEQQRKERLFFLVKKSVPGHFDLMVMYITIPFSAAQSVTFIQIGLLTVIPSSYLCYKVGDRMTAALATLVNTTAFLLLWMATYFRDFHREHFYLIWIYYFLSGERNYLKFKFGDFEIIKINAEKYQSISNFWNKFVNTCRKCMKPHGFGNARALQWGHDERDGVSNHQPHDYLLNRLFRR